MRFLFLGFGILFTLTGFVFAFIPALPTTIFLILATGCFAKSSPKLEAWLLNHRRFGSALTAWRAEGSISMKHKIIAISMLWASIGGTVIFLALHLAINLLLLLSAAGVTAYLVTRPTLPPGGVCPLRPAPPPDREFGI